jgi:hypothetical protein
MPPPFHRLTPDFLRDLFRRGRHCRVNTDQTKTCDGVRFIAPIVELHQQPNGALCADERHKAFQVNTIRGSNVTR